MRHTEREPELDVEQLRQMPFHDPVGWAALRQELASNPGLYHEVLGMSRSYGYIALQSSMQHENRAYTAVANILKRKHGATENAIHNVR